MLKKKIPISIHFLFQASACLHYSPRQIQRTFSSILKKCTVALSSGRVVKTHKRDARQNCEIVKNSQDKIVQFGRMVQTHPTADNKHIPQHIIIILSSLNIPCLIVQVGENRLYQIQNNICKINGSGGQGMENGENRLYQDNMCKINVNVKTGWKTGVLSMENEALQKYLVVRNQTTHGMQWGRETGWESWCAVHTASHSSGGSISHNISSSVLSSPLLRQWWKGSQASGCCQLCCVQIQA